MGGHKSQYSTLFQSIMVFSEVRPRPLFCSKSAAKSRALVAVFADPLKIDGSALPNARIPLFRLFYQVEIRHHQIPSSKIPNPLTAADARDSTTRLWQLRGRYVEIAGSPAAFG
ncbi:MAG: hypothetical protein WA709_07795 [Stellaceae bacterium]